MPLLDYQSTPPRQTLQQTPVNPNQRFIDEGWKVLEGQDLGGITPTEEQLVELGRMQIGEPGVFGTIGRGLTHGTLGVAESVGIGTQWLGKRIGSEAVSKAGEVSSKYWGKKAKAFGPPESISGKNVVDNPELLADANYWLYNIPDMLPALGASVAATLAMPTLAVPANASKALVLLAKLGRYIPAFAIGGGLESTQTYKSVLEAGGSEESAARSAELMGLGAGVLNAIGTGKLLNVAGKKFKTRILRHFGAAGWEGLTEGLEEPTEVISKYLGKYLSGEKLPDDLKEQLFQSLKDAATVAPIAGVTGLGGSVMAGKDISKLQQEKNTFLTNLDTGLTTGKIGDIEFTPDIAIDAIRQAKAKDILTDEDINQLKEKHPTLAPELDKIVKPEPIDLTPNKKRFEENPLDAENNAEYLDKYLRQASLPRGKALTTEEITRERAKVLEEAPRRPAEVSAEVFEEEAKRKEMLERKFEPEAEVPFMITKQTEADLSELGYTPEDINKMKPEEAQGIVEGKVGKEAVKEPVKFIGMQKIEGEPSQPLVEATTGKMKGARLIMMLNGMR